MARKMARKDRMEKKLPRETSSTSVITGFICDDKMTQDKTRWHYSECCQDPDNWEGRGEWQEICGPDSPQYDPWYSKGYRAARDVYCKACGTWVIATEYGCKA